MMFVGDRNTIYPRQHVRFELRHASARCARLGKEGYWLSKGPVISIVEDVAAVRAATENLVKSLGFKRSTPSPPRRSFSSRNAWRKLHV